MPKQIRIEQGQCLMDIAEQHCGEARALFEIAELNGISITEQVAYGSVITVPDHYNPQIVKYLADKKEKPATGDAAESPESLLEGVGYWYIEQDNKVK